MIHCINFLDSKDLHRDEKKRENTARQRRNRWSEKSRAYCDLSNHELKNGNLSKKMESWLWSETIMSWLLFGLFLIADKGEPSIFFFWYFYLKIFLFLSALIAFISNVFWFSSMCFWLHSICLWLPLMSIFTFNLPGVQISFREIVNPRICQKSENFPLQANVWVTPGPSLPVRPTFINCQQIYFSPPHGLASTKIIIIVIIIIISSY